MTRRQRKLVGTVAMLGFVVVYALGVMALMHSRLAEVGTLGTVLFYAVAGLAWIIPLLPLIRWMERPDAGE